MKKEYLFRIKNSIGEYYMVDPVIGVITSTDPQDLDAVSNWKSIQLLWERDTLYKGVFRKYAPEQFELVEDAARILRFIFNTQGNGEAIAYIEILKWKKSSLSYVLLGEFQFNFGKHYSEELFARETVMEGGLTQRLNAYDTTDFSVPMLDPADNPEFRNMLMDGILLTGQYNYSMIPSIFPILGGSGRTMPIVYIDQEGRLPFGIPNNFIVPGTNWPGGDFDTGQAFKVMNQYEARVNIDFNYYIPIGGLSPDVLSLEVWVEIRGNKPSVSSIDNTHIGDVDISGGDDSYGTFSASTPFHDFSADTLECYYFVYFKCISSTGSGMTLQFSEGAGGISIEYKNRQTQTIARVISHWELFKKLVGKISGNEVSPPAYSSLLTTDVYPGDDVYNLNPFNTYFTCGDALRGLPTPEGVALGETAAELITNLNEFTQHGLVSNCAGIGIELIGGVETVVYEHLSHFFRSDVMIYDFGENISDFRMTLYDKYRGNSIIAGYEPQTYDEVNGRYEFNSQASFKAPVIQTIKDIDYTSPYRADCYGIEYSRINLEGKKTTDNSSDNDTFIIQSNGNDVLISGVSPNPIMIDRAHNITAGIPSAIADTVFNVTHSIQREMGRLLPFLSSNYYGLPDTTLSYEAKSKNAAIISSMYGGADLTERSNINMISSNMLYKPFVFSFSAPAAIDLDDLMTTQPYGYMRVKVVRGKNSCVLDGYVLKAGLNPTRKIVFEFDLLCTADTIIPDWL